MERARRAEEGGADARARSKELENRLGRLWDLERFSDEEGYRDRTRHSHLRYRSVLWIRNDFFRDPDPTFQLVSDRTCIVSNIPYLT